MLIALSPSKTLDESEFKQSINCSEPYFKNEIFALIDILKKKNEKDLQDLMGVSQKIAELNYNRFQNFSDEFTAATSKPALFYFKGDVYENMDVKRYSLSDLDFAQDHLIILSGLYGLLRPLDLIQPYRLEMGTRLADPQGKNLYSFWGDKIAHMINHNKNSDVVINLASEEYFKAVNQQVLKSRVINIIFKNKKNGQLKTIGLLAKRARGMMADYIIRNQITAPEKLKKFDKGGYQYADNMSSNDSFVFVCDEK